MDRTELREIVKAHGLLHALDCIEQIVHQENEEVIQSLREEFNRMEAEMWRAWQGDPHLEHNRR